MMLAAYDDRVRNPAKSQLHESNRIRIFQGDITDPASLRRAMQGCGTAFHLAAWYELGQTGDQVADETFEHCGRFTCEYERTKLEAHRIAQHFAQQQLPLVTVLPCAVYGEGDPSLIGETFTKLARGTFPALIAGVEQSILTYVHVDDVVQGILLAAEKGRLGETYILAGEVMSFGDMIDCVTQIAGSKRPRLTVPLWIARAMAFADERGSRLLGRRPLISQESLNSLLCSFAVSSAKARSELGFRARPNREGFAQTLSWIQETVDASRRQD